MLERLTSRARALAPVVACLILGVVLSGCALGRTVVDIPVPVSMASNGAALVKIVDVRDQRTFETAPGNPSTPSLEQAADISNPMITSRAVGRKSNGFGQPLGDIVLPEGRTVSGLVRAAMQKALHEKGYRVVDEGSPDYARAAPVTVDVKEFWMWFTPGAFVVTVECRASVNADGSVFTAPTIEGYAVGSGAVITEGAYTDVVIRGLNDLTEKMKAQIKAPS